MWYSSRELQLVFLGASVLSLKNVGGFSNTRLAFGSFKNSQVQHNSNLKTIYDGKTERFSSNRNLESNNEDNGLIIHKAVDKTVASSSESYLSKLSSVQFDLSSNAYSFTSTNAASIPSNGSNTKSTANSILSQSKKPWQPTQPSLLMKEPWKPQSSSTISPGSKSLSYLEQVASKQLPDSQPKTQTSQSEWKAQDQAAYIPSVQQSNSVSEQSTTLFSPVMNIGNMKPSFKMKQSWKPSSSTGTKKIAATSYLDNMTSPPADEYAPAPAQNHSPPVPTQTNFISPPAGTSQVDTRSSVSTFPQGGMMKSPSIVPKGKAPWSPKSASSQTGSNAAVAGASYLDNIADPSGNNQQNIAPPSYPSGPPQANFVDTSRFPSQGSNQVDTRSGVSPFPQGGLMKSPSIVPKGKAPWSPKSASSQTGGNAAVTGASYLGSIAVPSGNNQQNIAPPSNPSGPPQSNFVDTSRLPSQDSNQATQVDTRSGVSSFPQGGMMKSPSIVPKGKAPWSPKSAGNNAAVTGASYLGNIAVPSGNNQQISAPPSYPSGPPQSNFVDTSRLSSQNDDQANQADTRSGLSSFPQGGMYKKSSSSVPKGKAPWSPKASNAGSSKSPDTMIPPFERTTAYLGNLAGSNKSSGGGTEKGRADASLLDMKFLSFEEQPLQITEEFIGITKAPKTEPLHLDEEYSNVSQTGGLPGSSGSLFTEAKRSRAADTGKKAGPKAVYENAMIDFESMKKELLSEGKLGKPSSSTLFAWKEVDERNTDDYQFMSLAISLVKASGGETKESSAFPGPTYGAVLVSKRNEVLGTGVSDYKSDAVVAAIKNAGFIVETDPNWSIFFSDPTLAAKIEGSTLYLTLEPTAEGLGEIRPSITSLIKKAMISRVVIGSPDPSPDREGNGATALKDAGIDVLLASKLREECDQLIQEYATHSKSKLRRMAWYHFAKFGRPLGLLHCSVVDSDNVEAFARSGNSFGTKSGEKTLSYRKFGAYELAPPPDTVWADPDNEDDGFDEDAMFEVNFDNENFQGDIDISSPVIPWYSQVDAVIGTFPRSGNGPPDDDSVTARLNGLKWLAVQGQNLPPGVERILVMDATDLKDLPLTNNDPNLPAGVDVESFWKAEGLKPPRLILRRSSRIAANTAEMSATNLASIAKEAEAAARKTSKAAQDAHAARLNNWSGSMIAEYTKKHQQAALEEFEVIKRLIAAETESQTILDKPGDYQAILQKIESMGVIIDKIENGEPIDVMKHLGEHNGLHSVVWRAGCWGERGVKAILAGAFQCVSAHVAVDAIGGKFWQLMIAENAVQAACGPQSRVQIIADQEDISLEYCDEPDADSDCVLTINGRPVRHVRLDCRISLHDEEHHREQLLAKTKISDIKKKIDTKPWQL